MSAPDVKYLKDYTPLNFDIDHIELTFRLFEDKAIVDSILQVSNNKDTELYLDGEDLTLVQCRIDDVTLDEGAYLLTRSGIIVKDVPENCVLSFTTEIYPQKNTALEGLYKSSGNFCTQCEAEGFRKITYFPDRPDMMTVFTCTVEADKTRYPVLLSNGNLVDKGDKPGERHFVTWEDPFKKPCYLFALVAGDLFCQKDTYTTRSGRNVGIEIFVEYENADKCLHAVDSLKKAMAWDETMFDREYDLDVYMIVAVNDFNMGAMENKGLNVFNAKYVLAKPETATDLDYQGIETVIAHEYFHNWTGNRVTLQNWFQLCLKEGLTVFRDQEFTPDMTSRSVTRIDQADRLRNIQFPEDEGPMAHPVMPPSYIKMNNFYTVTIYEKGSEIIRMIHTIIGRDNFKKAMDLYFERHDGQAVTNEDFISAMEDASGISLAQFRLWYTQAGTPIVNVERRYNPEAGELVLRFSQFCNPTPGQDDKKPMHIPIAFGLVGADGNDLPVVCDADAIQIGQHQTVLNLCGENETIVLKNLKNEPVPSLLRGFSAPVKLTIDLTDDELIFLLENDTDAFNKWEAGQKFFTRIIFQLMEKHKVGDELVFDDRLETAFQRILSDTVADKQLIAKTIQFPTERELGFMMTQTDTDAIHHVREFILNALAISLKPTIINLYDRCLTDKPYTTDKGAVATRALKNCLLRLIGRMDWATAKPIILKQFDTADNMTDQVAALSVIAQIDVPERKALLDAFYEQWQKDTLVLDKWFAIQATSKLPDTLATVTTLLSHEKFSLTNPNKVRALIGSFCAGNQWLFHNKDGSGYAFAGDQVKQLDTVNPQIAARIAAVFNRWKKFDSKRQAMMQAQLKGIADIQNLSPDVFEIVNKALL